MIYPSLEPVIAIDGCMMLASGPSCCPCSMTNLQAETLKTWMSWQKNIKDMNIHIIIINSLIIHVLLIL